MGALTIGNFLVGPRFDPSVFQGEYKMVFQGRIGDFYEDTSPKKYVPGNWALVEDEEVYCLLIGSVDFDCWALALRKSPRATGCYKRVGLLTSDSDEDWFHEALEVNITIA
jgi:hypothetical protein